MNSLSAQAILGAASAVVAAIAASLGGLPAVAALVLVAVLAALVYVAFAAQSERLRDERRLVYRPVYARRQGVQRRIRSED